MSTASSSIEPPNPQVFISFRGEDTRLHFIGHLVKELNSRGINVFIDNHETMGEDLTIFYEKIERSKIALAVISSKYTKSFWCLNELAKIKECVDEGKINVFPVFYKVSVDAVRNLTGPFGDRFRVTKEKQPESGKKWTEALQFLTMKKGLTVNEDSDVSLKIDIIADEIKKMLISIEESEDPRGKSTELAMKSERSYPMLSTLYGIETRLEKLEEKLILKRSNKNDDDVTRVIGAVGMPGIGKTTIAKALMEKWQHKFVHKMFVDDICEKSKYLAVERLEEELLSGLWNSKYSERSQYEETHRLPLDYLKNRLSDKKVFIVLDGVTEKSQIEGILSTQNWIKHGSKVVIISSNMSAIEGIVDDTYMVPQLNHDEALKHFEKYAGDIEDSFKKLACEFVDYSRGNPLTLKVLGSELYKKDKMYWESKLKTLVKSPILNNFTSMSTVSSSIEPSKPQVFINFRGEELRLNFINHLVQELKRRGINVFIDNHETVGEDLSIFYQRIRESKIALAVISSKYAESIWCLNELAKIKECAEEGELKVFPVFYKVSVDSVRYQTGPFGDSFRLSKEKNPERAKKWKEALQFVTVKNGHSVKEESVESLTVDIIADEIKKMLLLISTDESENPRGKDTELAMRSERSYPMSSTLTENPE